MPSQKLDRLDTDYTSVRGGIIDLLKTARSVSARSINAVMTATYWEIRRRIVESEMGEKSEPITVSVWWNSSRWI
jgi:hypothetical protein